MLQVLTALKRHPNARLETDRSGYVASGHLRVSRDQHSELCDAHKPHCSSTALCSTLDAIAATVSSESRSGKRESTSTTVAQHLQF